MTEVLTVAAHDIRPGDGVTEGTVVLAVTIGEEDVVDLTGAPGRAWFVTVELAPARVVVYYDDPDYGHIHGWAAANGWWRRYALDELVRVGRPAPMAPCACGYPDPLA
jgi:hypothetical protein